MHTITSPTKLTRCPGNTVYRVHTAWLLFASILLAGSCRQPATGSPATGVQPDSVAAFLLKKDSFSKAVSFPGELIPLQRAELYAKVAGYVKRLHVDIGDPVRRGQVVAELEAPEMAASYSQLASEMQTARAKLAGSQDAYQRILRAAQVEGTVAAGEMERLHSQLTADSSAYEAARSRLAAYGHLKDYLEIHAPFDGVVTQRNVDAGALVGTGPAKPLLVVEDTHILRLRLPVPENYTAAIPQRAEVLFSADAFPGQTFTARLSRKAGSLAQSNRTETWEFLYDNNRGLLKPGMLTTAILRLARREPTFLVPAGSLVTNLERRFVIRLHEGRAQWVDVRAGISLDTLTEVFGPLRDGDTLLIKGSDEISQGTPLRAVLK